MFHNVKVYKEYENKLCYCCDSFGFILCYFNPSEINVIIKYIFEAYLVYNLAGN